MVALDKSQLVQSLSRMIDSIEERLIPGDTQLIPTG
jgi:hypothetical protein